MERLVFGTGPIARAESRLTTARTFQELLGAQIGAEVVVIVASSYTELSGLVTRGEADVAWLPPAVYVRASEVADVRLLLGSARTGGQQFSGVLFVKSDAPWSDPRDLGGTRVAWVDHDSCAGYLFPRLALADCGLDPDELFASQFILGSHHAVARAVEVGKADVGATFVQGVNVASQAGWSLEVDPNDMRAILYSAPIPADVICASGTLDPSLRDRVVDALAHMHETPGGTEALQGLFDVDRFVPAREEDYEMVRRAMSSVNGR
jgi:phosphonate transport system substrate-binding protein